MTVIREQGEQYRVSEGAMVVTEPDGQIRAMVHQELNHFVRSLVRRAVQRRDAVVVRDVHFWAQAE